MSAIENPSDITVILSLILAFVMTLLALASYRSYESTKTRLEGKEAELKSVKGSAEEFRQRTSEAFADQKSLRLQIDTLERSLATANKQLDEQRHIENRVRSELHQLRMEYEATKQNLTEAYRQIRNKE
jgi:chromosome segregation ATPase